ncbi:MAG: UDP-glucose/GDP-mannose dehydrogenase family protein [Deltaproteobacteria bacterium]|nr:UDP-glucose/GDP-mannose dehydrogenase family protein [Deltaproteobacteria bacterium]
MELCVVGSGYVGLVVGVCMADLGFRVTCCDREQDKIDALRAGRVPIYEPGLEPILRRNQATGRLAFSTDTAAVIERADVVYIAVGTPGLPDGSADTSGVMAVADLIRAHMRRRLVVVIKSTVPVGTADAVRARIGAAPFDYDVVSNPEFLKEGAAIDDFMRPDRIVIGHRSAWAREVMEQLYAGLVRTGRPIFCMDNRSAELTKYASNAMLATKISFMNELSRVCEAVGADVELVRKGVGSDTRIGPRFLFAGVGYGGSCFPKDVKALIDFAAAAGVELRIANAVEDVNASQKHLLADKVIARFGADLSGLRFAVWGLAFKPQTDDMREAPSLVVISRLLAAGASVRAYDPEARHTAGAVLQDNVHYAEDALDAVDGADGLLLVTEWNEFRNPDLRALRARMRQPVLFDGRNIYDPDDVRAAGLEYFGVGRPGPARG